MHATPGPPIRDTLASVDTDAHSYKPARDALDTWQRGAATLAVVPGGDNDRKIDDGGKTRSVMRENSCASADGEEDARKESRQPFSLERKKYVHFFDNPAVCNKRKSKRLL